MKLKSRQRIKRYDPVTTFSPNLDIFFQMVGNHRMKKTERLCFGFFTFAESFFKLVDKYIFFFWKRNMSKRDREKVKGAKIKCRSFIVFTHIRHHLFTIFSQLFPFFNAESPCKNTFSTFRCFWSLNQSVLEIILGFAPSSIYIICEHCTCVCVYYAVYMRWSEVVC